MSHERKVQPLIDEVTESQKPKESDAKPPQAPPQTPPQEPPQPAELDQDPGGGFNPDHTYPQT